MIRLLSVFFLSCYRNTFGRVVRFTLERLFRTQRKSNCTHSENFKPYSGLEKGTGTIINISAPKTKAANRIIPLNQTVVEFLKKHWMKQTELLGKEYATGDHYVLSRIPNKPVEPKFMQMRFKRFLCESHITDANFHALRHTFATRALKQM